MIQERGDLGLLFLFCYNTCVNNFGGIGVEALLKKLTVLFGILVGFATAFLGLVYLAHFKKITVTPPLFSIWTWGVILLVLTVFFGVALPILMRTLFHSKAVKNKKVEFSHYERLQINLIVVSMIGAYTACLAYLFLVPKFHLYASIIAGLYGIYAAIPARRKISADLSYYSLKDAK
ncbi:MAG: hypothetical protein KAR73_10175 [Spirochaetales bacterium]|nr:hypothetical protein [Spirochaetales bacterium]